MIAALITSVIDLAMPLINLFIRNSEKNREMKEKMFKMIENHSSKIQENVTLRRGYEDIRRMVKANREDKNGL